MKKIFLIFIALFSVNAFANNIVTQDIIGGCDASNLNAINDITNMIPVFEVNTYTCASGTFLPANTLGCRACPNGYTCNGGTFSFNAHVSQGLTYKSLVSTSTQYTCSTNFLSSVSNVSNMIPVFEPNTVSLTWNDDNGNTTQTTCTYDGLIALPEPPTRPGYTFNGWKLVTHE